MRPNRRSAVLAMAACLLIGRSGMSMADGMRPLELPKAEMAQEEFTSIGVRLDFARVLTLAEPARTVIIGNPAVVDGTLSDAHTVVLTGRAVGATNLIVLNEGGREILSTIVAVSPRAYRTTTVYSGAAITTYSCTGSCKPVVSVGDDVQHFSRTRDQIRERQDLAGAATSPR